ncbi:MAG: tyrosine-type recombinase/integrase [bacterium]|nr:tyrosine-type recombinase/integrase [bacterium]
MKQTLVDYLDNMQYARGIAKATREAYTNDLTQLLAYLQTKKLTAWTNVSRDHLIQYIDDLHKRGFAEASLLRNMASIRGFFGWLLDEGIIEHNPTDAFIRTRHHRRLPFTLAENELIPLIEAVDGDSPEDLRDRAILELLYGCGLRCFELIGLRLHDLQKREGTLRILGKGNKERIVPYGPPAAKALHRYLLWRQTFAEKYKRGAFAADLLSLDAPMFLTMTGKRLHRSHLSTIIRTRIRAFLPEGTHATPHTLRHAFATHLLNHGAPLIDISELLGHANVGVTEIYTHVSDQHLKDEFNRCFPRS